MAVYDITQSIPDEIKKGDILNCPYSGTAISITLPKGIYKLECWGAQGGSYNASKIGGKGGYSYGELNLTKPETLHLYSGGQGAIASGSKVVVAGGWNGGGSAYSNNSSINSGSGGGGSDIRINGTSLYSRVIVAGGGGGYSRFNTTSSYSYNGGAGGGISGITGLERNTSYKAGTGGSQTAGGTSYYGTNANSTSYGTNSGFGIGGSGTSSTTTYGAGGGGGGWYGGGYGRRSSGGGGSGYVYDATNSANYPSGCLLNANCYLSNCNTINGASSFIDYNGTTVTGHEGNGCCRITVIDIQSVDNIYIKIGNEWKKPIKVFYKEGNAEKELPKEYEKVEYIESNGTQFIKTGVLANEDYTINIDCCFLDNGGSGISATQILMGAYNNESGVEHLNQILCCMASTMYGLVDGQTAAWISPHLVLSPYSPAESTFGTRHKYKCVLNGNRGELWYDGVLSYSSNDGPAYENSAEYYLFCAYDKTTPMEYCFAKAKLYGLTIDRNDGSNVRDFVPCYRKLDGEVGLYDLINDVFYTNQGSGTFTKGNNILPSAYQELTYIEGTGTQYIDTGVVCNQNSGFYIDCSYDHPITSTTEIRTFFGCGGDGTSRFSMNNYPTTASGEFLFDGVYYTPPKLKRNTRMQLSLINKVFTDADGEITTLSPSNFTTARGLYIFGSSSTNAAHMKLYKFRIYNGTNVINDLYPCYRKSDGKTGVYDTVTGTFFPNMGIGEFSRGDLVLHDGEFAEVAYLESNGTQYIDTDFIANNDTKVEVKINTNTNEKWLFGGRQTTTSNIYGMFLNSVTNGDIWFQYGTNGATYVTGTNISDQPTTIITDKNKWYLNGVLEQTLTASTFTTPVTMKICTIDTAGALDDRKFIGKIYYFKIWDNNQLIRDLRPCVDHNLVPCLYDTISKKAFYNAGTGSFTVGGLTGIIYPVYERGWVEITKKIFVKGSKDWHDYITDGNLVEDIQEFTLDGPIIIGNKIIYSGKSGVSMATYNLPTPIPGHLYYGRVEQCRTSGTTIDDGRFEYYNADIAGTGLMTFAHFSECPADGEWHSASAICSLTGLSSETDWKMRMFAVNPSGTMIRRYPIIIDLTEKFGAGNEPSKEWCDEHIYYCANNDMTIQFDSNSDLELYELIKSPSGNTESYCNIDTANSCMKMGTSSYDKWTKPNRHDLNLKMLEMKYRCNKVGSKDSNTVMTLIRLTLKNGDIVSVYPQHWTSYEAQYLPFPSYTNHTVYAHKPASGTNQVIFTNSLTTWEDWHHISFEISEQESALLIYSSPSSIACRVPIPSEADIESYRIAKYEINLNDGWFNDRWTASVDWVRERT